MDHEDDIDLEEYAFVQAEDDAIETAEWTCLRCGLDIRGDCECKAKDDAIEAAEWTCPKCKKDIRGDCECNKGE